MRNAGLGQVVRRVVWRHRGGPMNRHCSVRFVGSARAAITAALCISFGCRGAGSGSDTSQVHPSPSGRIAIGEAAAPCENLGMTAEEGCSPELEQAYARLSTGSREGRSLGAAEEDVTLLTKVCEAGHPAVCNAMGALYIDGTGLVKDPAKGAALFKSACDGGVAMGCINLAYLHQSGLGVERDLAVRAKLLERACSFGSGDGCYKTAINHAGGTGVPKDVERAAQFYGRACDGGLAAGCAQLASLYEVGAGVEKDPARAARLKAQACELGSAIDCTDSHGSARQ
jgi:hypothetical protein